MIAVIQRVRAARVEVAEKIVAQIPYGMLALVAVHRGDDAEDVKWLANKLVSLRIFRNAQKHFDLDIRQVGGSLLLVSNFTVAGQTRHGRRPSFEQAADPATAQKLFEELLAAVRALNVPVQTGIFAADMQVSLSNDGPVTFIVDTATTVRPTASSCTGQIEGC